MSARWFSQRRRPARTPLLGESAKAWLLGFAGMAMFSQTLTATRVAVADLDPIWVALARALVAATLAGLLLAVKRVPLPPRRLWRGLAITAIGVVVGFPVFSSWAMGHVPAAHGAVLTGLVPLATALVATLRNGERPSAAFWICALAGSGLVLGFALRAGGGHLVPADWAMFAAVVAAAFGYAEGARVSKAIGSWQTICWALVGSAPLILPVVIVQTLHHGVSASLEAWTGFAYVSVFSMFIGFFAWYRGLALGGVARIGQIQLLQPFLTLIGAFVILGERFELQTAIFALAVAAMVALGRRTRVVEAASPPSEASTATVAVPAVLVSGAAAR